MSKRFKIFLVFVACFFFAPVGADSLTLTQAKIMALEKNHDIRVWMLGVDAARGEHKSRQGVYDPEISFMAREPRFQRGTGTAPRLRHSF